MEFIYSTKNPEVPVAYARLDAMHTRCEILLPRCPEEEARERIDAAWELVRSAERRYNRHDPDSELSRINRDAGTTEVEIDEEMFLVLQFCATFRAATRGWFDISAHPGSRSEQDGKWILDATRRTVRFSRPDMSLDLGGFAKGFVLEQVSRQLAPTGCGIISFGGSSTYAIGRHPLGAAWPVSIPHLYYKEKLARTFQLSDTSLSVSGKDRSGRGHIIDPHTGNTVEKEGLIAVQGRSAMVSETLSTALWVAPEEERKDIISSFEGYDAWEILCLPDGKTRTLKI
ncbi:MAG: FAD:protein FMN transferase [Bacteroidales bacterium]|nr:FAD:protein FMN transferase [Bacteroidales bacterium]